MRTKAIKTQCSLAVSCSFAAILVAGCYRPDVGALTEKLREECRIAPSAPRCALEDPDGSAYVYERWVLEEVDTPAEEECLLDVRCDPNDGGVPLNDISRCVGQDDPPTFGNLIGPDQDCVFACDIQQSTCGGEEPCGIDVVNDCAAERDACVRACPSR